MGSGTYSNEEIDEVVAKRLAERKEIINQAVAALQPTLEAMRREIAGANHVKRSIGRQVTRLAKATEETNRQLQAHISLVSEMQQKLVRIEREVDEFGLPRMTIEERAAAPEMLRAWLAGSRSAIFREELVRHLQPAGRLLLAGFLTALASFSAYLVLHHVLHLQIGGVHI